jgi:hypothetical protein
MDGDGILQVVFIGAFVLILVSALFVRGRGGSGGGDGGGWDGGGWDGDGGGDGD